MELVGITWNHPRGYEGLELATERYLETRPDLTIRWDRHSLRDFESHPLPALAEKYDFIILDHPFMGDAQKEQCLFDLSNYEQPLQLEQLSSDVVGKSLETYRYEGALWALPIDAASQTAVYRKDLLKEQQLPKTLDDIRQLAKTNKVALALHSVHAFNIFAAICANLGFPLNTVADKHADFVDSDIGTEALDILKELASYCPEEAVRWNAIDCLEAMSERNDLPYAPYVFAYSSYSGAKANRNRLTFTRVPSMRGDDFSGAVIGGTGIAISKKCQQIDEALSFVKFVTSVEIQLLMGLHNGQPTRRSSWLNHELNNQYDQFYTNTLTTIESAYVRPRFPGFIRIQNEAGKVIEDFLTESGSSKETVQKVNKIFHHVSKSQSYNGEFI